MLTVGIADAPLVWSIALAQSLSLGAGLLNVNTGIGGVGLKLCEQLALCPTIINRLCQWMLASRAYITSHCKGNSKLEWSVHLEDGLPAFLARQTTRRRNSWSSRELGARGQGFVRQTVGLSQLDQSSHFYILVQMRTG